MSVFIDMLVEMLPMASSLQNTDNEFRKVLDYTIGAYMEDKEPVFDELFLSSATGGWLDAFGRDYGVTRKLNESDEDYRNRIIFEKLEYLTADNLKNIFGVELYNAYDGFDPTDNQLTSDNTYLSDWYVGIADETTRNILNKKFILDNTVMWYDGEALDYIYKTDRTTRLLKQYLSIYQLEDGSNYFKDNTAIGSVKLDLSNITYCQSLFEGCTGLTTANVNLKNCITAFNLFKSCTNLTDLTLDISGNQWRNPTQQQMTPNAILGNGCTGLTYLNVNVIESYAILWKNAVVNNLASMYSNLEMFILNGEEIDLE